MSVTIKVCCPEMEEALMNDFVALNQKNAPVLLDDSGAGGIYPFKYCPFCGHLVKVTEYNAKEDVL